MPKFHKQARKNHFKSVLSIERVYWMKNGNTQRHWGEMLELSLDSIRSLLLGEMLIFFVRLCMWGCAFEQTSVIHLYVWPKKRVKSIQAIELIDTNRFRVSPKNIGGHFIKVRNKCAQKENVVTMCLFWFCDLGSECACVCGILFVRARVHVEICVRINSIDIFDRDDNTHALTYKSVRKSSFFSRFSLASEKKD